MSSRSAAARRNSSRRRSAQRPYGSSSWGGSAAKRGTKRGSGGMTRQCSGAMVLLEGMHPLKHALRLGARVERAVAADPARVVALARELAPDVAGRIAALLAPGDA